MRNYTISRDKLTLEGRKGVGLGLAFCKQAIEAHGGFIWVKSPLTSEESARHQGCRFYFILPAGPGE